MGWHLEGEKKNPFGKMKDYSAVFELQDFLEKEVKDASPGAFYRSFVPLTDGLGLESPTHPPESDPTAVSPASPSFKGTARAEKEERKQEMSFLFEQPLGMSDSVNPKVSSMIRSEPERSGVAVGDILQVEGSLSSVMRSPSVAEQRESTVEQRAEKNAELPPPIPQPSSWRRLLAALIDQLFVFTFWAIAIVITSNVYNGFTGGLTAHILKDFSNPVFLRFALLEFGAIWLCYFAICVGVLDLTFGMWVWNLRVSFGNKDETNYWLRKLMRVVWSFFFFAPVVTTFLLTIRRKGRNLLDLLSGTHLYVST